MKKLKRWIRNKLRKFLYVDELENNLSELNAIIQTSKSNLEYEIKKINRDILNCNNVIDALHNTIENVVHKVIGIG